MHSGLNKELGSTTRDRWASETRVSIGYQRCGVGTKEAREAIERMLR